MSSVREITRTRVCVRDTLQVYPNPPTQVQLLRTTVRQDVDLPLWSSHPQGANTSHLLYRHCQFIYIRLLDDRDPFYWPIWLANGAVKRPQSPKISSTSGSKSHSASSTFMKSPWNLFTPIHSHICPILRCRPTRPSSRHVPQTETPARHAMDTL